MECFIKIENHIISAIDFMGEIKMDKVSDGIVVIVG
jgi:hypothetical protein